MHEMTTTRESRASGPDEPPRHEWSWGATLFGALVTGLLLALGASVYNARSVRAEAVAITAPAGTYQISYMGPGAWVILDTRTGAQALCGVMPDAEGKPEPRCLR